MRMFRTVTDMNLVVRRSLGPNGCGVKRRNPQFSRPPTRPGPVLSLQRTHA
jgi:hypothetical protein